MANWASTTYAIEGSKQSLENILGSICLAITADNNKYEEYNACVDLGFTEKELEGKRLRGEITEQPKMENGVLKFCAEEAWGLQDFEALLRQKSSDIKVYWIVEEPGLEVYVTNDKEGKYFSDRYWVDTAQDDIYQSEYFKTEEDIYKWLSEITHGRVNCKEDVETFNAKHENSGTDAENFIHIHEFTVV